jgi:cytoskeletal protein CcmA (bactofilin family)
MSTLGKTIVIKGEVRSLEDMNVEGRVEGPVFCDGCAVVIGPEGSVEGEIVADDITVFGRMQGQLIAADIVDLRAEATVTGQIVSKRFVLNDGARFNGHVEPQHLEAALRVARFQQQQKRKAAAGQ